VPSMPQPSPPERPDAGEEVILGIDTHKDVHVAVVISLLGVVLGRRCFPTTASGYETLLDWARGFGALRRAGVECTGSYRKALTRYLRAATGGIAVIEVNAGSPPPPAAPRSTSGCRPDIKRVAVRGCQHGAQGECGRCPEQGTAEHVGHAVQAHDPLASRAHSGAPSIRPDPATFLSAHAQAILAIDFAHVETAFLRRLYILIVIEHDRRRAHLAGITADLKGARLSNRPATCSWTSATAPTGSGT
jgi:hypothetical protein